MIVDTIVWLDYFRGVAKPETDWVHADLERQRLGLTDLILCEVLQRVRDDVAAKAVERELLKLQVFDMGVPTWPVRPHATPERSEHTAAPCARRSIV